MIPRSLAPERVVYIKENLQRCRRHIMAFTIGPAVSMPLHPTKQTCKLRYGRDKENAVARTQ